VLKAFVNAFKIPDLRKKILFTLLIIAIYRLGCHVPVPVVDVGKLQASLAKQSQGLLSFIDIFSGGALTRKGERKRPGAVPEESYRRQERWMGRWTRTIQMPPRADLESISASLENGLLLIRIPKLPEATPKSLPIKVGRSHQEAAAPRNAEAVLLTTERSGRHEEA
jgi:hypothetical protein